MRCHLFAPIVFAGSLVLAACSTAQPAQPAAAFQSVVVASVVEATPLGAPVGPCAAFVAHDLPHTTLAATRTPDLYDSNGAGLAIGDLDADGDQDLVLANLAGPATLLWNQGNLQFQAEPLGEGRLRGLSIVDVDGDGWLDIVGTRQFDKPVWWRNTGETGTERFEQMVLPDVNNWFYAHTWDDLDRDGDLDLVAASYDTEILKREGLIFQYRGGGVGVFVYERHGDTFRSYRLSDEADALAIALPDLDRDGRRDIWIGNDFNRPDYVWTQGATLAAWQPFGLPQRITENTMGLDLGDVNNDGMPEIFATDMKPVHKDVVTMAQWLPAMQRLTKPLTSDDPQYAENTLLLRGADGIWRNEGYERSVDSTGWSWSGVFGDLDRDGLLDLYVVNGMIAAGLLGHLPNGELVEANVVLRNTADGRFSTAPEWELGSRRSGRGMAMADFDGDGDLDIVVNNLASAAQLFENRLCGGSNLLVDLRLPETANQRAIGAELALVTNAGTFYREVRATAGYLSGTTAQVHFGIPPGAVLERLDVRWPDGTLSSVDTPLPQHHLLITRTDNGS